MFVGVKTMLEGAADSRSLWLRLPSGKEPWVIMFTFKTLRAAAIFPPEARRGGSGLSCLLSAGLLSLLWFSRHPAASRSCRCKKKGFMLLCPCFAIVDQQSYAAVFIRPAAATYCLCSFSLLLVSESDSSQKSQCVVSCPGVRWKFKCKLS